MEETFNSKHMRDKMKTKATVIIFFPFMIQRNALLNFYSNMYFLNETKKQNNTTKLHLQQLFLPLYTISYIYKM